MLEVCRNQNQELKDIEKNQRQDIIVTKYETKVEYKNGAKIEKRIPKKVNITKMVNERKKVIKQNKAQETLNEIEKIFTNKGV